MVKKVLLFVVSIFFILSCEKDENTYIKPLNEISACECDDPLNQLEWLHELAYKSLNDKTGNYIGNIWIISYENSDIIVTNMALGSGGILYYFFDCEGTQHPNSENLSLNELNSRLTGSAIIFSSYMN
ncbi:MAG TPA: hypothetical protein VEP89_07190 [Draconibacterium sp.]|nr:hypothetical protein [Draconibacterium sp.]